MGARATADILVKINGDTKDLRAALRESDKGIGGLAGNIKGQLIGGGFAAAGLAALAFGDAALQEADRARKGYARLAGTLGEDVAGALRDSSDQFADWGLSSQDVLELQGYFADVAKSIGVTNEAIGDFAGPAAEAAAAVARLKGIDTADAIDKIAKAATLGEDDLATLGISLTEAEVAAQALADTGKPTVDALTDSEKAAAAYKLILEKLAPKIDAARDAQSEFGDTADSVGAKWETLMGRIGTGLEGPLDDLLTWTLEGFDGWTMLFDALGRSPEAFGKLVATVRGALGPLGSMLDVLNDILHTVGIINDTPVVAPSRGSSPNPDRRDGVTIVVQGGSADDIERQVVAALRDHERRNR